MYLLIILLPATVAAFPRTVAHRIEIAIATSERLCRIACVREGRESTREQLRTTACCSSSGTFRTRVTFFSSRCLSHLLFHSFVVILVSRYLSCNQAPVYSTASGYRCATARVSRYERGFDWNL